MSRRNEVLTIYVGEGPLEGIWCPADDVKRFQTTEAFGDLHEGIAYRLMELGLASAGIMEEGLPHKKLKAANPEQWSQLLLLVTADHAVSYNASVW